jgi:hypothetical protein
MSTKPTGDERFLAWFQRREFLLIALIGLFYIALIGRYSASDGDNSWFLSFSHSFWIEHVQTDTFMLNPFPGGMGGVLAFGKIPAAIQGVTLSLVGWSLTNALLLCTAFTLLSLVLLAQTCRRLGYSANFILCYIALLGFTEPFVAVSHRARYEFLSVFLLSLALWLAARNKPVLAMFVAALATEVEPAAAVIGIAIATFLLSSNARTRLYPTTRLLLRIFLGTAVAIAVYLFLHPNIVTIFRTADWANSHKGDLPWPGGFITVYFFVFHRHLPELVVLLSAVALCLFRGKRHLLLDWPALCILVIVAGATLLRWPNAAYFCFIAPFTSLFVLQVFYSDRRRNWILAAILLYTLPQYAWRYKVWSSRDVALSQSQQNQVAAAITRASVLIGKPPEQLHILGDYNLWFAHPHLFVSLNRLIVTPSMLQNADLILCFDQFFSPTSRQDIPCQNLNLNDYKQVETMSLHNNQLRLLLPIHR